MLRTPTSSSATHSKAAHSKVAYHTWQSHKPPKGQETRALTCLFSYNSILLPLPVAHLQADQRPS